MKQLMMWAVIVFMAACENGADKTAEPVATTPADNGNRYSAGFSQRFDDVLKGYYQLKDALVASDTAAANIATRLLKLKLDSLSLAEVQQADSVAFASVSGRPGDIAAELTGLLGEADLEKKRESFELVSNAMYDVVRSVRPGGQTIYYQYCPMAFNDKGAYWLSNADSIRNPYFGKKMLTCGEVVATLRY